MSKFGISNQPHAEYGMTSTIKNNEILQRLPAPLKYIPKYGGQFPALVQSGEMWLVGGQRVSVSNAGVYLIHRFNDDMNVAVIHQDDGFNILTNNQGTVEIKFGDSSNMIYAFAIRLY